MKMRSVVRTANQQYVVVDTADVGTYFETMVFRSDAAGYVNRKGYLNPVDEAKYSFEREAEGGHIAMVGKWTKKALV